MMQQDPLPGQLLLRFQSVLGDDFEKYGNHVQRIFANCLLLDGDPDKREHYAIAAVFHDIGIWTAHTFDYLEPSMAQARLYLAEAGMPDRADEICRMIYWHHKFSRYEGEYARTVEVFRKADWMDVSLGILSFGADRLEMRRMRRFFPNAGFHLFLLKQIVKNFFRHPLNPVPVFKK
jgi:hypothetical protein